MGDRERLYCFAADCYIGTLDLYENGRKIFTWVEEDKLSDYAKRYKFYTPLDSTYLIDCFIEERVISRDRPDASVWLSLNGMNTSMSDVEIFIGNHGICPNDIFWCSKNRDSDYWTSGRHWATHLRG